MRGRKPKPTHLKLINGNPGKRPLNKAEPIAPGSLQDAPDWMTGEYVNGWRYAIEHAPQGLLRLIDRSAMAAWVVAETIHRQATIALAKTDLLVKTPQTGAPMQNPYLPIINRQAQIMLKAAAELGFTPSSRSRVSNAGEPPKAENPFLSHGRGGA